MRSAPFFSVLKNGSCAIRGCESCQVGNQAALSDLSYVPRGCLFGAVKTVNACRNPSILRCTALSDIRKQYLHSGCCAVGFCLFARRLFFRRFSVYRALYRKWRPADFDSVCGQSQIIDILKYQVANNKTSHAYLFCGSRGTGKTSCAKIFAKAVNCLNPNGGNPCNECEACRSIDDGTATDVIEMDAASNTGVDNVRDIKEEIVFSPAILKYRVYIIDEVHMMSGSAFNALLKTLEEPPPHVIFILATTELHKLPSTIISRCQRFDFRRMTTSVIIGRLMQIAESENIELTENGARLIARMAVGGMRDAISLLELCAGMHKKIDYQLVFETIGCGNRAETEKIVRAVLSADYNTIYSQISDVFMNSRDIVVYFGEIIDYYRDMMLVKTSKDAKNYLELTDVEFEELKKSASECSLEKLVYHSKVLEEALSEMQKSVLSKRSVAELALTRLCEPALSQSYDALLARISDLESEIQKIKFGISTPITNENNTKTDTKIEADKHNDTLKEEKRESETDSNKNPEKILSNNEKVIFWNDTVDKIKELRPSLGACLNNSKAFKNGCKYTVYLSSSFFVNKVQQPDSLRILASVISSVSGTLTKDTDISITSGEVKKEEFDFEQELNL